MTHPIRKFFWAGFSDGQLFADVVDDGFGGFGTGARVKMVHIFTNRKEARARFQDVRRVEIREVKKPYSAVNDLFRKRHGS